MTKQNDPINAPILGDQIPQKGNWFTRGFGRTAFRIFGWRFEGAIPNLPKFVIAGGPHTSNWDLPLALTAIWAAGVRVSWLGKHTAFWWPLGAIWRRLGGVPVDRTAPVGVVQQIVDQFEQREQWILGLSPEGTRKKVEKWKTGFYRIAHGAELPILPLGLDYSRKTIIFGDLIMPTGDADVEIEQIRRFLAQSIGKNPELGVDYEV